MSFGCPGGHRIRPLLFHNSSRVLSVRERDAIATITEMSPAGGSSPPGSTLLFTETPPPANSQENPQEPAYGEEGLHRSKRDVG